MNAFVFVCMETLRGPLSLRWYQQPPKFLFFVPHSQFSRLIYKTINMFPLSFHFLQLFSLFLSIYPFLFFSFQLILSFGLFHFYPHQHIVILLKFNHYPYPYPISLISFRVLSFLLIFDYRLTYNYIHMMYS